MLAISKVETFYGNIQALRGVNVKVNSEEIVALIKGINTVAKKLGISIDVGGGYRTLSNIGSDGGQEVPHLHFHLFGGEKVGKMIEKYD